MSVDLLRQQPRWKEALVSLREMMTSLIQQVHSFVNGFTGSSATSALKSEAVIVGLHNAIALQFKVNVNLQLGFVSQLHFVRLLVAVCLPVWNIACAVKHSH